MNQIFVLMCVLQLLVDGYMLWFEIYIWVKYTLLKPLLWMQYNKCSHIEYNRCDKGQRSNCETNSTALHWGAPMQILHAFCVYLVKEHVFTLWLVYIWHCVQRYISFIFIVYLIQSLGLYVCFVLLVLYNYGFKVLGLNYSEMLNVEWFF